MSIGFWKKIMRKPLLLQQQFSILQKAVVVETNGGILAVLKGIFTFVEGKRYADGVLRSRIRWRHNAMPTLVLSR